MDITDPQTWNRYAYVRNTPTSLVDPSGLELYYVGGCLYNRVYYYVDNQFDSTEDFLLYCEDERSTQTGASRSGGSGGGGGFRGKRAANNSPSKTGCFVKGVVAGAATALVVGSVAVVDLIRLSRLQPACSERHAGPGRTDPPEDGVRIRSDQASGAYQRSSGICAHRRLLRTNLRQDSVFLFDSVQIIGQLAPKNKVCIAPHGPYVRSSAF